MYDEPSYFLLSFLSEFFVGFGGAFGRRYFPTDHFLQLKAEAESTPDSPYKCGALEFNNTTFASSILGTDHSSFDALLSPYCLLIDVMHSADFAGSEIVIVHPGPSLFSALTEPPIAVMSFFTRARPIPVPPVLRVRSLSTR